MGTLKKTVLAAMLGTTILMTPAMADAGWHRYRPVYVHRHHHFPPALIGLGIASAVLGTAAVVHSIVHPPFLVAAPPPPPPPSYYDEGYRRGYDDGRRDYDDRRYDDRYGD
jgi:hypothetical protein